VAKAGGNNLRRSEVAPRSDWQERVEKTGLTYHTLDDGSPYWDESAYWEFSAAEIDRLEAATAEIQRLALAAGEHIIANNRFAEMKIPAAAVERIRETWRIEPPALYGRLDLAFDGLTIKLLEYNADTPTALVEAAVTQWYWLKEVFPEADQFNSLHDKLVAKWKDLRPYLASPVYFGDDGSEEDSMTTAYLRDTAEQAGLRTISIRMKDIGWQEARSRFVDLERKPIGSIFKLYPWEWLLNDRFAPNVMAAMDRMWWIEPIWKMLWSNKALLAILWELNPGHEFLLPAYLDGPREMKEYVRKPIFGREGSGVEVFGNGIGGGRAAAKAGSLRAEDGGVVYQQLASLAMASGKSAMLGSWLIDGEPAGIGIRESEGLVTTNVSRFVPHLFWQ
jgi:glutathionylspermidine synthase